MLSDRLTTALTRLRSKGRLTDSDIELVVKDIKVALLEADVALPVVREFTKTVQEKCQDAQRSGAISPSQQVLKVVHDELVAILGGSTATLKFNNKGITTIMLVGLQGAGKTTFAAKLALWLSKQKPNRKPLLVADDLARPNAVLQLQTLGKQLGIPVFAPEPGNGIGDPVQVARDAKAYATKIGVDVIILDTAGRLAIDKDLMNQAAAIKAATTPENTLFVLDAMTGQDVVATSRSFADAIGFDAVALTKLDGDARGGAALSVKYLTSRPIMFISTGEKPSELELFHPDRFANRILDLGDILTLIEQAEAAFDQKETEKFADKLSSGQDFNLNDFLTQLNQVRKLGSLSKVLGLMPGMGQVKEQISNIDEKDINRTEGIIRSMTKQERDNPAILNESRRARVAAGSGVPVDQVDALLDRFEQAKLALRQYVNEEIKPQSVQNTASINKVYHKSINRKNKKKGVSGNPAKRAAQLAEKNR